MPMRRSPARGRGRSGVVGDPGDDRLDGPPADAHQLPHRAPRAPHGPPGDLVIKAVGVPGAVPAHGTAPTTTRWPGQKGRWAHHCREGAARGSTG